MAIEMKLSITCDRCKRVEPHDAPPEADGVNAAREPQFTASLQPRDGKEHVVQFVDLCGPCENTVSNLLAQIGKKVEKKSPNRTSKKS